MRKISDITALQRGRSRGLSLVELLVASAIGIIASLAIFQVFAVFEGQKRTTASGGEAQTNGTLALFTLERELRMAGYGINNVDFLGCSILGWDEQSGGGTAFTLTLVPVIITQGAGSTPGVAGAPDTISLMYGTGDLVPTPANIAQNMPSPSADFKVNNRYGFKEGDIVIAAEVGKDCTLSQASGLPGTPGQTDNVIHNSGNYTDPNSGAQVPTRYNKPGGLGVSYSTSGKLFNLGALPANNVYTVASGQLLRQQLLSAPPGSVAVPIYDSIVQLQAQYGKDTNNDGVVDAYDEAPPTTAAQWAQVLAVRIAVVARSGLYEKDYVSPGSIRLWEDSANPPTTTGPVWTLLNDPADDRHYRYKVFQTVVPIRNMIWRP
jgi:type IV pilus assembly protein PilW